MFTVNRVFLASWYVLRDLQFFFKFHEYPAAKINLCEKKYPGKKSRTDQDKSRKSRKMSFF